MERTDREFGGRTALRLSAITFALIILPIAWNIDWHRSGMPPLPPLEGCYSHPLAPSITFAAGRMSTAQAGVPVRIYDYDWDDVGPILFVEPSLSLVPYGKAYRFESGAIGVLTKSKYGEPRTVTIPATDGDYLRFAWQRQC